MTVSISPAVDGWAGGVLPSALMVPVPRVIHAHEIAPDPERWVLTEETVPESRRHDRDCERVRGLFLRWAEVVEREVMVSRNLAVRWDEAHPQYGVDPDVCIVEPPPAGADNLPSLRLWEKDHRAPLLAVEIVSENHPTKDYVRAPEKYAVCGVGELWVLDGELVGPRADGGPHRIQVWRRGEGGAFVRVYAGAGPAWSEAVRGWIRYLPGEQTFSLSSDKAGLERWLTPHEADQAARKAAEQRIRELEALLAKGR